MKKEKLLYVLHIFNGECRGVYSSLLKLKEAVDYHVEELSKYDKKFVLQYEERQLDYIPEALGWDWAYISLKVHCCKLYGGGRIVPHKEWFGKNLIGIPWKGVQT